MQPRINKNQKVKSRKIYFSTKFKWCTPKIWFLRWCLSLKVLRQTSHEYGRLVLPQISFMCLCKLSCLVKKLQQFGHWKIFFKPTIKTKSNPNFGRIKLRVFEVSLFSFLTGCSPMGTLKKGQLIMNWTSTSLRKKRHFKWYLCIVLSGRSRNEFWGYLSF